MRDSTGRQSQLASQDFRISTPDPIPSLTSKLSHYAFTPCVVELSPDLSKVNFPNTRIVRYEWTSNVETIDQRVTQPPHGALTAKITLPSAAYWAAVVVVDSHGKTARAKVCAAPLFFLHLIACVASR